MSRTAAQEAILAGGVSVGGVPASKPAMLVGTEDRISVTSRPRDFVSRGGRKLAAALDRFGVDPSGRNCLDAGASTGGFTDCLLQRGATRVVGVDVGYGQFDWGLRNDPRVELLERTNVKELTREGIPFVPDLVVADLSFISLRSVIRPLAKIAAPRADFILLVKPQFEAGRELVGKGGVVRDPGVWRAAIEGVAEECRKNELSPLTVMASPLRGPAGNVEFLLHARLGVEVVDIDPGPALAEGSVLKGDRH